MNLFINLAVLAALSVNMAFSEKWTPRNLYARRDASKLCQSGDGRSYRGYVQNSESGRRCLSWNLTKKMRGLGSHNYCRNPDQSLMPWCYVKKGRRTVKEFCTIPMCDTGPRKHFDTERTCGERSTEPTIFKIVGGSFTTIESHPWVAAIFINGRRSTKFNCGGSLITPCWVLTAAHCFPKSEKITHHNVIVYLGKSATNETHPDKEQKFTVEEMILHQQYHDDTYNNDIALLKIKGSNGECAVRTKTTRTVCLPPLHTKLPAGFHCRVAGYGRESVLGGFSKKLKQAKVNLISQDVCESKSYYGNLITKNMICAASSDWKSDSCEGDSGGPLVCEAGGRMFLFGVVSWGEKCAVKNKPGVYTQVTNYNNWIAAKTGLPKFTQGVMYPRK